MLKKLLKGISLQKQAQRKADLYRGLIRHEGQLGGQLFGALPPKVQREFFCLDANTWVWHEEWIDQSGQRKTITTRYDVRPSGIIKSQNGNYQTVGQDEARRLYQAARIYQQRINSELYGAIAQSTS